MQPTATDDLREYAYSQVPLACVRIRAPTRFGKRRWGRIIRTSNSATTPWWSTDVSDPFASEDC